MLDLDRNSLDPTPRQAPIPGAEIDPPGLHDLVVRPAQVVRVRHLHVGTSKQGLTVGEQHWETDAEDPATQFGSLLDQCPDSAGGLLGIQVGPTPITS